MRRLLSLVPLALLCHAQAAEVSCALPNYGANDVAMLATATNNDPGVVYDSLEYGMFSELAAQLHGLPQNAVNYATVSDLMNAWGLDVIGQADNGWNPSVTSENSIRADHVDGVPGFDYDSVFTGRSQSLGVFVYHAQLELNATAGYQAFSLSDVLDPGWDSSLYDAIIVRSDNPLLAAPNYAQPKPEELMDEAFVALDQSEFNSYSASGHYYVALSPADFAEWTDFTTEHPGLVPTEDDNSNGLSNFLDYASGQDPEATSLLPVVEITDSSTLTLRRRINGSDALATAQYSDNLDDWYPLEEGVHYTVQSELVDGVMRTLVLKLLPGAPSARFFRQSFGP